MIVKSIQEQIIETDIPALKASVGDLPYDPYPFQWAAHRVTAEEIRRKESYPFVVKAAVSAGKTTLISLTCRRVMQLNKMNPGNPHQVMVISRQAEIVEQDHAEMRNFGVPASVFCAGLNSKGTTYPIIVGSEKTVVNALPVGKKLDSFSPLFLLIDECQHVDVTDIIQSEQAGKKVMMPNGREWQNPCPVEDTLEAMINAGRKGYTIIIREFQRRCMEKYGKELRVIGYTGTDYRGIEPIINEDMRTPGFWRKAVCDISTDYLVDFGAVVPTYFGAVDDDLKYDLSEFGSDGNDGAGEFSDADLEAMQAKILAQGTLTQKIMIDVQRRAANRNGVLVTCAGRKHCEEAAAALAPGTTYGIVTQDTKASHRRQILKDAYDGKCKYVFQVAALTTGVNIPPWDTSVTLRKIGSLTLLVQLFGRGMRILKKYHEDLGLVKTDHQVWDYAGTMDDLGELYFAPMLEQYRYEMDVANGEFKTCPICQTKNGEHARRCRNITEHDNGTKTRCEYFWTSRTCEDQEDDRGNVIANGCGCANDIVARFCRECGNQLIDPNKKLSGKHYTVSDYVDVVTYEVTLTKCGTGIVFKYGLLDPLSGEIFKAYEIFWPESKNPGAKQAWLNGGILKHIHDPKLRSSVRKSRTAAQVMAFAHYFMKPTRVTHRKINDGKKDVITRKVFGDDE